MKTVLITGTNRGIGLGLVKALISEKSAPEHIIATCRKPAEATELQNLANENKNIHILQLEVTDYNSLGQFKDEVSKITGSHGLNVLINNAGIAGKFVKIGFLKPESMLETFNINTVAPVMLTKELLPLLKQAAEQNKDQSLGASRAAVVNISSILGSMSANDAGGYYPYRCSKAGLNAATKSLSLDLKIHQVLAVCVHPGWVKTEMGGPKAPMEVADSTRNIIQTIKGLTNEHNGAFLNYDGSRLSW